MADQGPAVGEPMGKAFILWLLGVPLGVVIILYFLFFRG